MSIRRERSVEAGFEAMYRSELLSMVTLGASLTGSQETGADLAHEAMLRAYRSWPTVGCLDRPGAWVRRALINLATDAHRHRQHEHKALGRFGRAGVVEPTEAIDSTFWSAVRALPDKQRAAVALRYIDDLTIDDIAEIMQVDPGTIKAALFSARKTLAIKLGAVEVHDDID